MDATSAEGGYGHGVSLLTGWLPVLVQILAAAVLLAAIGRRRPRWLARRVPVLILAAVAAALLVHRCIIVNGFSSDPAPQPLWVWTGLTADSALLVVLGWRGVRWPRRALSVAAVPLSLLCVGLVLNDWVGYFPTVNEAWSQLTAGCPTRWTPPHWPRSPAPDRACAPGESSRSTFPPPPAISRIGRSTSTCHRPGSHPATPPCRY
jgi:hypothetical protein